MQDIGKLETTLSIPITPFVIRIIIVIICYIVMVFILKISKDKKENYKIIKWTTIKELFLPAMVLIGILAIENIYYSKIIRVDYFEHLGYELLLILLLYGISVYSETKSVYKKESKEETEFSVNYITALNTLKEAFDNSPKNTEHKIIAFCTDDFNHFFEPLGIKYFLAQAKVINEIRNKIKEKNLDNKSLITKRIIVFPGNNIYEGDIAKALKDGTNLTERQNNINNIYLLHDLLSIDLYFVPKQVISDELKKIYDNTIKYKELDTLIIDDNYNRTDERNNCLIFEKNNNEVLINFVNNLIGSITSTNHNIYNAKLIKQRLMNTV